MSDARRLAPEIHIPFESVTKRWESGAQLKQRSIADHQELMRNSLLAIKPNSRAHAQRVAEGCDAETSKPCDHRRFLLGLRVVRLVRVGCFGAGAHMVRGGYLFMERSAI